MRALNRGELTTELLTDKEIETLKDLAEKLLDRERRETFGP